MAGGGGAVLLVLSLCGIARRRRSSAIRSIRSSRPVTRPSGATDTTLTFEDVDGNGVDDDCQDPAAAAIRCGRRRVRRRRPQRRWHDLDLRSRSERLGRRQELQPRRLRQRRRGRGRRVRCSRTPANRAPQANDRTRARRGLPRRDVDRGRVDGRLLGRPARPGRCPPRQPRRARIRGALAPRRTPRQDHLAVAQSAAVGGKNCNHGGAVSAAAKTDHSGPPGRAATRPTARARATASPSVGAKRNGDDPACEPTPP